MSPLTSHLNFTIEFTNVLSNIYCLIIVIFSCIDLKVIKFLVSNRFEITSFHDFVVEIP